MLDIFYIIIITVAIALFGGILYLIYLPFKRRLKGKGRLTDKLNRRINLIFVFSLCLIGVVLFSLKEKRTPSKNRLEAVSKIKLPKKFSVIKDEYQDMWQDYAILYEIQFDNNATTELIKEIKNTKFYNSNSLLFDSSFIKAGTEKAVWYKYENGYRFSRQDERITYSIEFDTLKNRINYKEFAD